LSIVGVAFIPYALIYFVFYSNLQKPTHAQILDAVRSMVEPYKHTIDTFLNRASLRPTLHRQLLEDS